MNRWIGIFLFFWVGAVSAVHASAAIEEHGHSDVSPEDSLDLSRLLDEDQALEEAREAALLETEPTAEAYENLSEDALALSGSDSK